jgi:hypothetical protein
MPTAPPAATQLSKVSRRQADVLTPPPACAGDQASAKGEELRRTVIRAVEAPAEDQTGSFEACSRSWRQSHRFPGHQPLSGRPAHRQAHACVGLTIIAAAAAVAATRPGVADFGRDGHLGLHQASLDERQAHPERQQQRQEQSSEPVPRRGKHDGSIWRRPLPAASFAADAASPMSARTWLGLDHRLAPT